jgi:60 kDa SS-A/Ro ribonucleoprotein
MSNNYANILNTATSTTPQTEPVLGKTQVENNAGGFVFGVTDASFLNRFLILGTEGGSYYAKEAKMTVDAAKRVIAMIKKDGEFVVDQTRAVSLAGRAPKNDAAIFVLALCVTYGDEATKKAAYKAIASVCRIGTHIFQFCDAVNSMRGWSNGLRRGVAEFYTLKDEDNIALQLVKYRQRGGWTHKDVMRLAHPKSTTPSMNDLFRWAVGKDTETKHPLISAFERVQASQDVKEVVSLVREYRLPWETLPTEMLALPYVWEALIQNCPMTAMIRNLGRLSSLELTGPMSDVTNHIQSRLTNEEALQKARVHPMSLLVALRIYSQGHGEKGTLSWTPNQQIKDALDEAFYLSFGSVEPINGRVLQGIDVSGSMGSMISGMPLSCREAAGAMAMVRHRLEPQVYSLGFTNTFVDLGLGKKDSLELVMQKIYRSNFGSTDCSLPMVYALRNKIPVDLFEIFTDSETYAGRQHPYQALAQYNQGMGLNAKVAVYGMTSTGFSIAEPGNPNMLDIVGFDTASPQAVTTWAKR